jgi:hypothetical protein
VAFAARSMAVVWSIRMVPARRNYTLNGPAPVTPRRHHSARHRAARAAPDMFMYAVRNGGFRQPIEAAILKGAGTLR